MIPTEISVKLAPYIVNYFTDCELYGLDDNLFAESYLLGYDEVAHLIPSEYKGLFSKTDFFNGASGFLDFNYQAGQFKGSDYTIMLLSNEDNSKALFLYVQASNFVTSIQTDILIADFMKDGDACA